MPTGLVLIHGGSHTGRCWDPTVAELAVQAPGVPVLAVDLPGRRDVPGDLATLTMDQAADAVVAQIECAGLDEVVLVGHSMAGVTMPGVAARLGVARVRRMIFLACCVPPQGERIMDTLSGPLRWMVNRVAAKGSASSALPRPAAGLFFCNGMTAAQKAFTYSCLCPDATGLSTGRVDRTAMPTVPRTWILTLRDRSLPPAKQRQFIANLGGVDEVIEIDTCHNAMISEPVQVARLLAGRVSDATDTGTAGTGTGPGR